MIFSFFHSFLGARFNFRSSILILFLQLFRIFVVCFFAHSFTAHKEESSENYIVQLTFSNIQIWLSSFFLRYVLFLYSNCITHLPYCSVISFQMLAKSVILWEWNCPKSKLWDWSFDLMNYIYNPRLFQNSFSIVSLFTIFISSFYWNSFNFGR